MSESTKVILIRHGETEWNLSGRWQGHADSPLSPRGVSQAVALGERMSTDSLNHFYTSDLERAQHTSRLVGEPSGWVAKPMESLRERDLGVLEGLTTDEMLQKHPSEYQSFRNDGPDYQVPGGESFRQFCDRCSQALEEVSARHPGERIGLVTHGGFLGAIFRYVLKIPLDAERNYVLLNCSINRLEKTDKGWNLVSWGDIAHLDGLDSLDDA
ncbi:MAG: histidine phosphatase family protein [Opitutales bacterium]